MSYYWHPIDVLRFLFSFGPYIICEFYRVAYKIRFAIREKFNTSLYGKPL